MKILYILLFHIIILLIYIIHNKTEYFRIQIRELDKKLIDKELTEAENRENNKISDANTDANTDVNTATDASDEKQVPPGWRPSPHHLFKEHSHIAPEYRCTLAGKGNTLNACIEPVKTICYDNIMPDGWQCYIDNYDNKAVNAYWTSTIHNDTCDAMTSKKAVKELTQKYLQEICTNEAPDFSKDTVHMCLTGTYKNTLIKNKYKNRYLVEFINWLESAGSREEDEILLKAGMPLDKDTFFFIYYELLKAYNLGLLAEFVHKIIKGIAEMAANKELNAQNLWSGCAPAGINSERANRRAYECEVKKGVGYLYNISTGETKKFINDSELKGLIRNINKNKKPINDLDKIYPDTNNKEYNIILDKYV